MKIKNIELPYIITIEEFESDEKRANKAPIKRKKHVSKKIQNTFPQNKRRDKSGLFFKALREVPSVKRKFYAIDKREYFKNRLNSIKKYISIESLNPYLLGLSFQPYGVKFVHFESTAKDFFYGKPVKAGFVDGQCLFKRESKFTNGITQMSDAVNKFKRRQEKAALIEAYDIIQEENEFALNEDSIDFSLENEDYAEYASTETKDSYLNPIKRFY